MRVHREAIEGGGAASAAPELHDEECNDRGSMGGVLRFAKAEC